MKQIFTVDDSAVIEEMLARVEYGTLALCEENHPYSLPINFVYHDGDIYFHGGHKGKKMHILQHNPKVALSVVEPFSIIDSFFSSKTGLACPATQFYKSIMIEGEIAFVTEHAHKVKVLSALMEKLQPKGGYKPLDKSAYDTSIQATAIFKLTPKSMSAKFKFGQHLSKERFEMILTHLQQRDDALDHQTIAQMKTLRSNDAV